MTRTPDGATTRRDLGIATRSGRPHPGTAGPSAARIAEAPARAARAPRRRTRGTAARQDRAPGALQPGRVPGVGEVDAGMQGRELAAAHEAAYVLGLEARLQGLGARDHAVLGDQQRIDVRHRSTIARRAAGAIPCGRSVDDGIVEGPSHLVARIFHVVGAIPGYPGIAPAERAGSAAGVDRGRERGGHADRRHAEPDGGHGRRGGRTTLPGVAGARAADRLDRRRRRRGGAGRRR